MLDFSSETGSMLLFGAPLFLHRIFNQKCGLEEPEGSGPSEVVFRRGEVSLTDFPQA